MTAFHSFRQTAGAFSQRPKVPSRWAGVDRFKTTVSSNGKISWQAVFATTLVSVGVLLLVGLYSSINRPDANDRLLLCAVLIAPALAFTAVRSSLLLDYLLIIVAINRELRRLLDWGQGQYDSTSLLSLLPLLVACLMLITIAAEWRRLPAAFRRAAGLLIASMAYAMGLGIVRNGAPALYECAEYVSPLIVLYYCVACRPSAAMLGRWVSVLGTLGVLVGAYGIYQWINPPPWDAEWVMWSGMYSSMGRPLPYELSICSTLESRGPAAMFFAVTAAALIALPALRRAGGAFLAVIPVIAMLLTQARTGLIYLVLTLLATAVFAGKGGGGIKILLLFVMAGAITVGILDRQEQSVTIFNRVATLGDLRDDGSANGRVNIASQGSRIVLTNPLGFGFGSGGNSRKLAAKPDQGDAVGDDGYLEILSTMGVPGALLYAAGLALIVQLAIRKRQVSGKGDATTPLGMGLLLALVPTLVVFNALGTVHACFCWILLSRRFSDHENSVV